jgi:hypothetical protein
MARNAAHIVSISECRIKLTAQLAAVRHAEISLRRLKVLAPEPRLHGAQQSSVLLPAGRK